MGEKNQKMPEIPDTGWPVGRRQQKKVSSGVIAAPEGRTFSRGETQTSSFWSTLCRGSKFSHKDNDSSTVYQHPSGVHQNNFLYTAGRVEWEREKSWQTRREREINIETRSIISNSFISRSYIALSTLRAPIFCSPHPLAPLAFSASFFALILKHKKLFYFYKKFFSLQRSSFVFLVKNNL